MNIYVGGINGSGKTSVIKRVAQLNTSFQHMSISSSLMELLGIGYEGLRLVPQTEQAKLRKTIINALIMTPTDKIFLIDGHYQNLINGVITPVTGPWIKNLDGLAYIDADINTIWDRLLQDAANRDRGLFKADSDKSAQFKSYKGYSLASKAEFLGLSKEFLLPHKIILNNDLDQAANRLIKFCFNLKTR